MIRRVIVGLCGATALLAGCTYGPPFWSDLVVPHHDSFPAGSARDARFVNIRQFGSQGQCEARLAQLGHVVRISSYEAVVHHSTTHDGRPAIEEHHCASKTLRTRAWFTDGLGAGDDHH